MADIGVDDRRPVRVLLVESRMEEAAETVAALRAGGFDPTWERVQTLESLSGALGSQWDVVLSDYVLPDFNAHGALDLISRNGLATPLIVVSDAIGDERVARVLLAGARDFILKSDLARLTAAVMRELERTAPAAMDADANGWEWERYGQILDTIPPMVWATRADGVTDYLNRPGQQRLGIPAAAISGWRWLDLVHPEDRESARSSWLAAIEAGTIYRNEYRLRGPDGGYRWYLSQAVPFRDGSGAVKRWVGTWTDIDALKRAEEDLRASESRFLQIANNIQEVFWLTNIAKQETVYVSPAYESIWGRSREDLFEDPSAWVNAIHPEDRDRVLEASMTRQTTGEYDEVYRIVRPDGTVRWIRDRAFPVHDEAGEVIRVTGVAEDITERRDLEESLRQAQKIEAIGLLAGAVAHDFNNVLTAICGNAEMALARLEPESPILEELRGIQMAARSATALTRQLLAFSRRKIVEPQPVSVTAVLRELEPLLRRLMPSTVEVRVLAGEERDDTATTIIDRGHLEQVVMNLVVNGKDAMPDGGTLDVRLISDRSGSTGWVGVEVADTGIGMDEETRRRAFEPLFTTKARGQGTGLGLFTIRGIVDEAGGRIELDSAPGAGTRFRVYFPASTELAATSDAVEPEPSATRGGAGGETVLVVEDNAAVSAVVDRILAREGYRVVVAVDGEDALERIQSGAVEPDLVMTDVMMPNMSGTELAERLRDTGVKVPILFTSGYTGSGDEARGIVPEHARFLEKPFGPAQLLHNVREILNERAGS